MGVSFYIKGTTPNWETGAGSVDVSNLNAHELLVLLGLGGDDLCDSANCRAFVRACDAALKRVAEADGVRLGYVTTGALGCTVVECSREAGYFARKLTALRTLAETGGDLGTIAWD